MPNLKINSRLEPFLTKSKPIKVAIGGRNSGKSIGFGDIFTMKMCTEAADIYCLREYQDSLSDSVHRVFKDSILKRLKIEGFRIQENTVIAPTGAKTTYRGAARNPDSIQSAQGYKYSWFEEAHRASQESLDKLLPTIIRNPGAECWFSANPQSSADPFSQRFIVPYKKQLDRDGFYEDELHLIVKMNWRQNPWWNEESETLRLWDYENLSRAKYNWIWEGHFNDEVDNSIIKTEWFDAAVDAHLDPRFSAMFKPYGAKVAAHDPSDLGSDAKGYCLRHGSVILRAESLDAGEIDEGCDWATGNARNDNADWFVWDGDGMGAGLKRQVANAFSGTKTQFHMFRGSLSGNRQTNADRVYLPVDNESDSRPKTYAETFKNNRAQYSWLLRDKFYKTYLAVVKGQYIDPAEMISLASKGIPEMDRLRSEVCRIPEKPNPHGLIQIMNKQDMKKLKIESPNMFDSIMMSQYSGTVQKQTWTPPQVLTLPRRASYYSSRR
ncbi:MAG: PBSX family phage terminase large subunit [Gammaproteobacteria bacterium]